MSIEDPEADRFEQLRSVTPGYETPGYETPDEYDEDIGPAELPLDADPLDVADQHRTVHFDDDPEG